MSPGQAFSLRQLGVCEPSTRRGFALCPKTGLSQPLSRFSRGPAAPQGHEAGSPEQGLVLWGRGPRSGARSGQSSCLSSRSNSALTLTDTEMDNDGDMGESRPSVPLVLLAANWSAVFSALQLIDRLWAQLNCQLWAQLFGRLWAQQCS